MEKNISKSPEMLQKEAKVTTLKTALKKRKSVLKSLKTRLGNTKKDIESTQREVQSMLFSQMSKMEALRLEIAELSVKMKGNKHFSKEDKEALDMLSNQFLDTSIFGEGYAEFQEQYEKAQNGEFDFDEDARAKMRDVFQQFQVPPEEKEQRNIRKVFIKLSRKFHPDLASNKKEEKEFHGLMQQINEAYNANDIQKLLEFEQLYLIEELDFTNTAITIDILQQEIERLERDVVFINNQIDRTSTEIKQLRKSDMGTMLTGMKKANREGEGLDAMKTELQQMIDMLDQLKEGFKDSHERGSISPILLQMMNPFTGILSGGEFDDDDADDEIMGMFGEMFESMFDDEVEEVENPTFPVGSGVKIEMAIPHILHRRTKMKNWTGVVEEVYYDENGKVTYLVYFDSPTMNAMPKKLLEQAEGVGGDFQEYNFRENELTATEIRDTEEERIGTYRTLYIDTLWKKTLMANGLAILKTILLEKPELGDEQNWEMYLKKQLPFEAVGQGRFGLSKKTKVKVIGVEGCNEEVGFIMIIQKGKKRQLEEYPLLDLTPVKRPDLYPILDLHEMWVEENFGF